MNWKLIFLLSLFGLGMAIATVFWIPSKFEPVYWLLIFIICAYITAKRVSGRYFWNGFFVSVVNSIWITAIHVIFYNTYISNHPQEAAMMMNMPLSGSPRLMMVLTGPIFGIISGLVLGLFTYVAHRILKSRKEVNLFKSEP